MMRVCSVCQKFEPYQPELDLDFVRIMAYYLVDQVSGLDLRGELEREINRHLRKAFSSL